MPAIKNTSSGFGYPGRRNAYPNSQGPGNFFGTPGLGYSGGRNAYADGRGPDGFFGTTLGATKNLPPTYFAGLSLGGMLLCGSLLALVILKK